MCPRPSIFKGIPRTVVALGVASLFTDLSSEMIYPLLPMFLSSTLGAGAMAIGIIEGAAESLASILKLVSGIWTDRTRRRKPLIVAGYTLSGAMRPLIGLATSWYFVLFLRLTDRIGKGIRSSPRDALIADVVEGDRRGLAYGFHRAMDHAGAVFGPLIAAALLLIPGVTVRAVFLLAAIPAAVVVFVLVGFVGEPEEVEKKKGEGNISLSHWTELPPNFKRMLLALLIFTLGDTTDAFVLLRLAGAGIPPAWISVLWSLHHVVKMVSNFWGGHISDRIGRKKPVLWGWAYYAGIYLAFGYLNSTPALIATFLAYGVYFGLTEATERAWVSDLVPKRLRGTAFGYYHLTIGLAALPGSLLFGVMWHTVSMKFAFIVGAGLAAVASVILATVHQPKVRKTGGKLDARDVITEAVTH